MTLAMSCELDDQGQQSTVSWLEARKAEKARSSTIHTERETLTKELESYMEEPNILEHSNPFQYWAENKAKYPTVAMVARAYLGIPATSVASERVFSRCGLVCSDRRSSLSPQHVEELVFLSQNLPE
jgi:hypothetical protein